MILQITDRTGKLVFIAKSYAEAQNRLNNYGRINRKTELVKVRSRHISESIKSRGEFRLDDFIITKVPLIPMNFTAKEPMIKRVGGRVKKR